MMSKTTVPSNPASAACFHLIISPPSTSCEDAIDRSAKVLDHPASLPRLQVFLQPLDAVREGAVEHADHLVALGVAHVEVGRPRDLSLAAGRVAHLHGAE